MSQSAATIVFATPELLENILLNHPTNTTSNNNKLITLKEPISDFYIWRRIDHTTNNIIMSSAKLRRLMFIEPLEAQDWPRPLQCDSFYIVHWLIPVFWIWNKAGFGKRHFYLTDPKMQQNGDLNLEFPALHVDKYVVQPRARLNEAMLRRRKASWRSLRALRFQSLCFRKMTLVRHFDINDVAWYKESLTIEPDTTLGEIYDWYERGNIRTFNKHREVLKAILKHGTQCEGTSGTYWVHDGRWGSITT